MEDVQKRNKRQSNWRKENMTQIVSVFHNTSDADILEACKNAKNRTDFIRKAIRFYLANNKEE
ncbi:hypothetical protein IJJ97_06380 [bacterium]|nr:hypothetical protein [bacterium]